MACSAQLLIAVVLGFVFIPGSYGIGCPSLHPCLYYCDDTSIKGIDAEASLYPRTVIHSVLEGISSAAAIDMDMNANMIYWSELSPEWRIRRINLTDGRIENIITQDLGEVEGLAVDWMNGLLFWTDFTYDRIEVAHLDGTNRKTLLYNSNGNSKTILNPTAITVHPNKGYIFWINWSMYTFFGSLENRPHIRRSTMDGRSETIIARLHPSFEMYHNGLVIDYLNDRLYWIESFENKVESVHLDGSDRIEHNAATHNPLPKDLALLRDELFYVDGKTKTIERMNRTTWASMMSFGYLDSRNGPTGIVAYNVSQQTPGTTACTTNNGNCSHLCLPTGASSKKCACPNGVTLLNDARSCSNVTTVVPPPTPPVVQVRLVGGRTASEGRVEIKYGVIWGTVCDDLWGIEEANVICRSLNYSKALKYTTSASFGRGRGYILLDNVKCRGDEKSISACQHNGWGIENCFHSEDAGVVCSNITEIPTVNVSSHPHVTGLKIRLSGGEHEFEGRVEVFYNNRWGGICDDDWTTQDANVVCRMAGYEKAWNPLCCDYFGTSNNGIILSSLTCRGDESSIDRCHHPGWETSLCTDKRTVAVTCKVNLTLISAGNDTIRLRDGRNPNEGRVELKQNGRWGTVCDNDWDIKDANVTCNQLGFPGALSATKHAVWGKGGGKIVRDHVQCNGTEQTLQSCRHNELYVQYCSHASDAGVVCRNRDSPSPKPGAESFLVVAEYGRNLIKQVLYENQSHSAAIPIPIDVSNPSAVAIDSVTRTVYFSTLLPAKIYRTSLTGEKPVLVVDVGGRITGLAVDPLCKKLYWSDYQRHSVVVSNLDGSYQRGILSTHFPKSIALDITSGFMYLTAGIVPSVILKAQMDGTNLQILTHLKNSSSPWGLAFDRVNNRIYWSEYSTKSIRYLDLSPGSTPKDIISQHINRPYLMVVSNGYLHWTETNTGYWGEVFRANIAHGMNHETEVEVEDLFEPRGLAAIDANDTTTRNNVCQGCECQQLCLRIPSGYKCACTNGFTLHSNGKACTRDDYIIISDTYNPAIITLPWNASNSQYKSSVRLSPGTTPFAVECDPVEQRLYFTDDTHRRIARVFLNGSSEETIIGSGLYSPQGIALDQIGRKLYFTDYRLRSLSVSEFDGSNIKLLWTHQQVSPTAVEVDPKKGLIYWVTEAYYSSIIHRADMDGNNGVILTTWSTSYYFAPSALALDQTSNRLYLVGWHDSYIEYVNLDDANPHIQRILGYQNYLYMPHGLVVTSNRFCWSDSARSGVFCAAKDDRGYRPVTAVIEGFNGAKDMHLCSGTPTAPVSHPCADDNNGYCSHLCLLKPNGYTCACPDNPVPGHPCHATPTVYIQPSTTMVPSSTISPSPTTTVIPTATIATPYPPTTRTPETPVLGCPWLHPCIYYCDDTSIKGIDAKTSLYPRTVIHNVLDELSSGEAIDMDMKSHMIYWSELSPVWRIRRINLMNGSIENVITEDLGEVRGLAVDWVNGLLFWTDFFNERLEVAHLNGSNRKTLHYNRQGFSKKVVNPSAIAVYPQKGYIFWTNWAVYTLFGTLHNRPHIRRSTMDGRSETIITRLYVTFQTFNHGLAIDYVNDRLYWIESHANKVESVDLDGGNRKEHTASTYNPWPKDLDLFRDELFYADGNSKTIERMNRTTWASMVNFGYLGSRNGPNGIVAYDVSKQTPGTTACITNNGGCSHLCLPTGASSKTCACPNGATLLNDGYHCSNVTTVAPPPPPPVVRVRLIGGRTESEGRVEVNYGGVWGTVCDDEWGIEEAQVICRSLNYSKALKYTIRASFGRGSGFIWLDNVKCRGDENSISACQHNGWGIGNCWHGEDAGVVCSNISQTPTVNVSSHPHVTGLQIRIRGGEHDFEGRVEVFYKNRWGGICDDDWTIQDANVVCRMAGYEEAWNPMCCGYFGRSNNGIILSSLTCRGDESSVDRCHHPGWETSLCTDKRSVGVTCKANVTAISGNETIRLRDGRNPNEGRVEVKYKGKWGTVCDDNWDIKDANVTCNQLGFPGALSATREAIWGRGGGKIVLDNLHCNGTEKTLHSCRHNGLNIHDCSHAEDAGVVCRIRDSPNPKPGAESFLVLTEYRRNLIKQVLYENQSHSLAIPIPTYVSRPDAVAIDPITHVVYFTSTFPHKIYQTSLTVENTAVIVDVGGRITGLAVDPLCKKLYWSDYQRHSVVVSNLDGSHQRGILSTRFPKAIALDITSGLMYLTAGIVPSVILKAQMDGTNLQILTHLKNSSSPWGLAFDRVNNRIYWSEYATQSIRYLDLSQGSTPKDIISQHINRPYLMVVSNGYLHWTERTAGYWGEVFRANIAPGMNHTTEIEVEDLFEPGGLAAIDVNDTTTKSNVCEGCNCQHLCLRIQSGHKCACANGYILHIDGKTCTRDDYIIISDTYNPEMITLPWNANNSQHKSSVRLSPGTTPFAVDCDPVEERLYFTDNAHHFIARVFLNGSSQETIIGSGLYSPQGIALDLVGRKLYFTNYRLQSLSVSEFDGSNIKLLWTHQQFSPTAVEVDSKKGLIYWVTESYYSSIIHRADMDGNNGRILTTWSTSYPFAPSALALDQTSNRLYLVGWHDSYIEYVNLDDANPHIQRILGYQNYLYMPHGLVVTSNRFCWSDSARSGVFCAAKDDRGYQPVTAVIEGLYGAKDMQLCSGTPTAPVSHPCADDNNGYCSHLCLLKPNGYTCACPDNPVPGHPCNTTPTVHIQPSTTMVSSSSISPSPTTTSVPTATIVTTSPLTIKTSTIATTETTKMPTTAKIETTTMPTTATTEPVDPCAPPTPCMNNGVCERNGAFIYTCHCPDYYIPITSCELYVVDDTVIIGILDVTVDEFIINLMLQLSFRTAVADSLNQEQDQEEQSAGSRRRKRKTTAKLTAENIIIPGKPTQKGNRLDIPVVVYYPGANGTSSVMPGKTLVTKVEKVKAQIGKRFGNRTVTGVSRKVTKKPHEEVDTGPSAGTIVGIVIAMLILVIIAVAVYIYFHRLKYRDSANIKHDNEPRSRYSAFNNPGYIGNSQQDDLDVGAFSRLEIMGENRNSRALEEDMGEASNPTYTISMTDIATSKSQIQDPGMDSGIIGAESVHVYDMPSKVKQESQDEAPSDARKAKENVYADIKKPKAEHVYDTLAGYKETNPNQESQETQETQETQGTQDTEGAAMNYYEDLDLRAFGNPLEPEYQNTLGEKLQVDVDQDHNEGDPKA